MRAPARGHVELVSAVSGTRLNLVACDIPSIIRPGEGEWVNAPVWRLQVVTAAGPRPLDGWHLSREEAVNDPVLALPLISIRVLVRRPEFINALLPAAGGERVELPNNVRKWRKEFRRHVRDCHYTYPRSWDPLSGHEKDHFTIWLLQSWARDIRVDIRHTRREMDFNGRYREDVEDRLAYRLQISVAAAQRMLIHFEHANRDARVKMLTFLHEEENQFHCFVL